MIVEFLIMGSSLLGCVGCWAAVAKHRISAELQKHKINIDLQMVNPPPEPRPAPVVEPPSPTQQSLTELLTRRRTLEANISKLREQACSFNQYDEKKYAAYRADTLKALEDARTEQQELVLEQTGLLEMMQGTDDDPAKKSLRVDTGGPVAERVDDPGDVHDVELHDEEASRESAA